MSSLKWENICFELNVNGKSKLILDHLTGSMYENQLVAILGPTGSGKTCLLNVLCGRVQFSKNIRISGDVVFQNHNISSKYFQANVAYVMQDDSLFNYLTVRETLTLAAHFHLPFGGQIIDSTVDNILRELALGKAQNTIIGSETRRGISGCERKRVAIGKQLMSNPKLIFLDEPTSNLDSFQAQSMVEALKLLASSGKLVMAVIHQPRSSIFAMIDNLLLISEGKTMYFGPAKYAVDYFRRYGYNCPSQFNPADYLLDLVSLDTRTVQSEIDTRNTIELLAKYWKNSSSSITTDPAEKFIDIELDSDECKIETTLKSISGMVVESFSILSNHQPKTYLGYFLFWFISFYYLTWRASAEIYRNFGSMIIKWVTVLFFAVILSLIYHNVKYTQTNIQDRTGLLYFIVLNQSFSPLISVLRLFPVEKRIVSKEIAVGSYPLSSYFLSRVLAEIPGQMATTIVFSSIVYWSSNLNPHPIQFIIFLCIVILANFCAIATGFLLGAISPNDVIANALGAPVLIILVLFGGFYINTSSLPVGSGWVIYISYIKWAFQALIINEFTGEKFSCNTATVGNCETTGEEVIARLQFNDYSLTISIISLICICIGTLYLAFIGLSLNHEKYAKLEKLNKHLPKKSDLITT